MEDSDMSNRWWNAVQMNGDFSGGNYFSFEHGSWKLHHRWGRTTLFFFLGDTVVKYMSLLPPRQHRKFLAYCKVAQVFYAVGNAHLLTAVAGLWKPMVMHLPIDPTRLMRQPDTRVGPHWNGLATWKIISVKRTNIALSSKHPSTRDVQSCGIANSPSPPSIHRHRFHLPLHASLNAAVSPLSTRSTPGRYIPAGRSARPTDKPHTRHDNSF